MPFEDYIWLDVVSSNSRRVFILEFVQDLDLALRHFTFYILDFIPEAPEEPAFLLYVTGAKRKSQKAALSN